MRKEESACAAGKRKVDSVKQNLENKCSEKGIQFFRQYRDLLFGDNSFVISEAYEIPNSIGNFNKHHTKASITGCRIIILGNYTYSDSPVTTTHSFFSVRS